MIKNYLLTAWRHLLANRMFTLLNVTGLAMGFLCCILILLFVRDEVSFDQWLTDADRVARLHTGYINTDRPPFLTVNSAGRMMPAIRDYAPDLVEDGVRIVQVSTTVLREDDVFAESVLFADGSFFNVLQLPFLHGDPSTAFAKPMDLVLTESMAIKYFGRTDVIGETLVFCCLQGEQMTVQVSGVIHDLPDATHLSVDFVTYMDPSIFDYAPNILNTWTSMNTYSYFLLQPGVTPAMLQERVTYWLNNESPLRDMVDEGIKPSERLKLKFMSVPDLHLNARRDAGNMGDMTAMGDINLVRAFMFIAVLVLIVACINFMNLTTARATRRAREIAMRKVVGASRRQITLQFMGEACLIAFLAMMLAVLAVVFVMPWYNDVIDRELSLPFGEPLFLASLLAITLFVGVIAGLYPSLVLSRFQPAVILSGARGGDGPVGSRVRNALVVFQFAVSIGLGICTLVIYGQTLFARHMDMGYTIEGRMVLNVRASGARGQQETIAEALRQLPGVTGVALSSDVPSQDRENNTGFRLLDGPPGTLEESVVINYYTAGYDFFELYDMALVAGRTFQRAFGTDEVQMLPEDSEDIGKASIVINESAARQLGFANPADAVGNTLRANVFMAGNHDLEIIGIARDVYFRSIRFGIRPSVFFNHPRQIRSATIAYKTDDVTQLTADIEAMWRRMVPDTPIFLSHLDDMVYSQYAEEQAQAQLFAAFSVLAVLIACLGLYGLAAFAAERRTREIGIRKVLGAKVSDIVKLLSWQFSIPVLIANAIAWPLAWYGMQSWLEGFSYRLDSIYILFAAIAAGSIALAIAWLTIAGRALRVARANPVLALRHS